MRPVRRASARPGRVGVGMVGFGRIGRLLARHGARDVALRVYDPRLDARRARALGAVPATLAQACAQEIVVLCVPISAFAGVVRRVRGLLRPGALVVDVCSVKEAPVAAMQRLLPRDVGILATHPLFGPDSAAGSLAGRQIVLCRVRASAAAYRRVRRALRSKGLEVVEMSPREHDRRMASSQVLAHVVGRALAAAGAQPTGVDTESYRLLLRVAETVGRNSWRLFRDINRYNAFAAPARRRFLAALRRTLRRAR